MLFLEQQSNLILQAIRSNNLEQLKSVITRDNVDYELSYNQIGRSWYCGKILPYCCKQESTDLEIINFLLDLGANVNGCCSSYGSSALYYAIQSKRYDIIDILLKQGANINQAYRDDRSPLECAVLENDFKSLEKLLKYGSQNGVKIDINNLLHAALRTEDISTEIIEMIIKEGADVNNKDKDIYPLEAALKSKRQDIIAILIDKGGLVDNLQDKLSMLTDEQADQIEKNGMLYELVINPSSDDRDMTEDAHDFNLDYFIELCKDNGIPTLEKRSFQKTFTKIEEENKIIYQSLDSIYLRLEPIINAQLYQLDETTYPTPTTTNLLETDKTDIGQKALEEFTKHRAQFFIKLFHKEQNYQFLLNIIQNNYDDDLTKELIKEVKKLILPYPEHKNREEMLQLCERQKSAPNQTLFGTIKTLQDQVNELTEKVLTLEQKDKERKYEEGSSASNDDRSTPKSDDKMSQTRLTEFFAKKCKSANATVNLDRN